MKKVNEVLLDFLIGLLFVAAMILAGMVVVKFMAVVLMILGFGFFGTAFLIATYKSGHSLRTGVQEIRKDLKNRNNERKD